ncbi:MAG: alpha/beta fold hydrolase [Actinomycetota bacterium]
MTLRSFYDGAMFGDVTSGTMPVIVSLHGWGRNREDLSAALSCLESASIALDLPGFGMSPPPVTPWGAEQYAALVLEALDEHFETLAAPPDPSERQAVLLGHSFGGRVALCMAVARPDNIRGLVLTGVPFTRNPGSRPPRVFRLARRLHKARIISNKTMEAARHRYGSADYRSASGTMRATMVKVVQETYEEKLSAVRCPVALVWGEADQSTPLAMAERASRQFEMLHSFDVIPGVGHDVPRQRPDLLRQRLAELCGGSE